MKKVFLYLLSFGLVSGCSSPMRTSAPAPIENAGGSRQATAPASSYQVPGGPAIAAYQPPAEAAVSPAPGRAIQVLMHRAEDQHRSKDYAGAVVSLERALRISPRDAYLWSQLARVRLDQGSHSMATQLASKSNALAHPEHKQLRRSNWLIIASAKRALGDISGARFAQQQADNS